LDAVYSTAYSLFVVGVTALVGAIQNGFKGLIRYKTGFLFALPAFIAVYVSRRWLIPLIPDPLFSSEQFTLSKDMAILVFFAVIMLLAAWSMIWNNKPQADASNRSRRVWLIMLEGLIVGVVTGLVGAGGGFLIIPALVLFAGVPMKEAVATSLMIIAIKSLIGFIGDIQNLAIDWIFLGLFSLLAISGIFMGTFLQSYINSSQLKKGFGWFVLLMGVYIIIKELII
jgi:uncharacterized membrane protein YfcA